MKQPSYWLTRAAVLLALAGCSKSPSSGTTGTSTPSITLSVLPTSVLNDGSKATLVVAATDATNAAGVGTVNFTASYGDVGGSGTNQGSVTLTNGSGSISYACDVTKNAACVAGPVALTVAWLGQSATGTVTLKAAPVVTPDAGPPVDGGPVLPSDCGNLTGATLTIYSLSPSSIGVAGATSLPVTTNLVALAQLKDGTNAVNCPVNFNEQAGESLLSLSSNTAVVSASGLASVTLTGGQTPGVAHVQLHLGTISQTVAVNVLAQSAPSPDGGDVPGTVGVFSIDPSSLEATGNASTKTTATVTLQVRSVTGAPSQNVSIDLAEQVGEQLVALGAGSVSTNVSGLATFTVQAGGTPGVAHIVARVTGTSLVTTIPIAINVGGVNVNDLTPVVDNIYPAYIITQSAAQIDPTLPTSTTLTVQLRDAANAAQAVAGVALDLAEVQGETLVSITSANAHQTTSASGTATFVVNSLNSSGIAHLTIVMANGLKTVNTSISILGTPSQIGWVSSTPDVLGVHGSNIQETGQSIFQVKDDFGAPVPNVIVDLSASSTLVNLTTSSAQTDLNGLVSVSYSSGTDIGVTSIYATIHNTTIRAIHPIAIRGATPSATGFYFRCERSNLPVYTTTLQYETMNCTVRLKDRYGNRVGIPVPVTFATESGAITANGLTKAFDINSPNDPDEGSLTVTFSSDQGNGTLPADVDPLDANPGQFPSPLKGEPRATSGSKVFNPRDQLVTIIAITQGEESFVDSNHNNQYDPGEIYFDLSDPYIDANDNNQYDAVVPNGLPEVRFCGASAAGCGTFHGPNGQWDSSTNIWKTFHVVFSGAPVATGFPTSDYVPGAVAQGTDLFSPTCADLVGVGPPISDVNVFAYDHFFNLGSVGTTYSALAVGNSPGIGVTGVGFSPNSDNLGSISLSTEHIAESDGGVCTGSNGTACLEVTRFTAWDSAYVGTLNAQNISTPILVRYEDGGSTRYGGCDQSRATFEGEVDVTTPTGDKTSSIFTGTYAPAPPPPPQ
jgi:hypothetical protein